MVYFLCKVSDSGRQNCCFALSLPVRGAWVEICNRSAVGLLIVCRSPCGERGLKCLEFAGILFQHIGRSPCGERGLKFFTLLFAFFENLVAPRAGSVG